MYRTHDTHQLVLKGIPDKYRGEMWMVFSGAVNEVSMHKTNQRVIKYGYFVLKCDKLNISSTFQHYLSSGH